MAQISVLVVVKPESSLSDVRVACERRGLTQVEEIPNLRILRGIIAQDSIPALNDISGVRSIEQERKIQLLPSGSPIQ
jgi:hypothetical protein